MFTPEGVAQLSIKYRIKNNLSQKELAKKLKISNKTLCNIEQKSNKTRIITLQKVGYMLKYEKF